MADPTQRQHDKRSPYTKDRGLPGAYEGETITRRRLFSGGAAAAGGIATAAFTLPALGFALGPMFQQQEPTRWEDVGSTADFNSESYVPTVITLVPDAGEAGKTTVYVRRFNPTMDTHKLRYPYVAISTRCMHLGCPVRFVDAAQRFICPCHGGVYDAEGRVVGGPPVRPLDRFETRVIGGRVQVGPRFSVNAQFQKFSPRDPSNHLDGVWKYLYPPRITPTT